ncbi:MAG: GntR family transcriptional regulator, partial [Alphaproteobacteria bacterium]
MTEPDDRAKLSPIHPDRWVRQGLSRAEFVYRSLSARIVDGRLSPGDRLDEASIAREFEVSRTPVREALQALTAAGLAYKLRHRGVLVASMPRNRLRDMFEVMADMEALCAGYAAERMTALQRYELEKFHRDSAALVRDGNTTAYAMFNRNFHTLVYMGSHNEVLSETARG